MKSQVPSANLSFTARGEEHIPISSIPGIRKAGWRPPPPQQKKPPQEQCDFSNDANYLYGLFKTILNHIKSHGSAWPFLQAVDRNEVHDYCDHIKYPMDLKTMTERHKAKYYHSVRLFHADMMRIFNNCRFYNYPDTEYFKCASALEKYYKHKIKETKLLDWSELNDGDEESCSSAQIVKVISGKGDAGVAYSSENILRASDILIENSTSSSDDD
ncbi:hypothetical protein HAZT_HAZT000796 [Hyalella azteca]|uniref:Bromo domain-containing protein n=1 Tax=Hyalella azteca TaxID=294128 RepID=A0A6A0GQL2_HYAAZ|nr:hypothetical protein HAZT_HAZT000796 [Hyalella azteca]